MQEVSVLTCPSCGHAESLAMPTDACQVYYRCPACNAVLRPQAGDCCVFCSYGSVPCPPIQYEVLEQRATSIAARLCSKNNETLCLALLRRLAQGQPVSPAQLAADLARPERDVYETLRQVPDVEWDAAGNVVGWGLSLRPTTHRFLLNSHRLYTWCALDAFIYPSVLGSTAYIESRCPVTSEPITLTVEPDKVATFSPESAVVSVFVPQIDEKTCNRQNFCSRGHFFSSRDVAQMWQQEHPEGQLLSPDDAHILGRLIAAYRHRNGLEQDTPS